jgi:nitrate reductase beta subunit
MQDEAASKIDAAMKSAIDDVISEYLQRVCKTALRGTVRCNRRCRNYL